MGTIGHARCFVDICHGELARGWRFEGEDDGILSCIQMRFVSLFVDLISGVLGCLAAQGKGGPHDCTVWRQNEPVVRNAGVRQEHAAFHAKICRSRGSRCRVFSYCCPFGFVACFCQESGEVGCGVQKCAAALEHEVDSVF